MLRMDNHTWLEVEFTGQILGARANFASCFHDSKFVIFGGIKEDMST